MILPAYPPDHPMLAEIRGGHGLNLTYPPAAPGRYRAEVEPDSPPTTGASARYRGRNRRTLVDTAAAIVAARVAAAVDGVTVQ